MHKLTEFEIAQLKRDFNTLKSLIERGMDVNTKSYNGETALMTACLYGNKEFAQYLIEHGADVNMKEDIYGETALMYAANAGRPECIGLLVEHGAEIDKIKNRRIYCFNVGICYLHVKRRYQNKG